MKIHLAELSHQKDEGTTHAITEVTLRDYLLEYVVGDNLFGLLNWMSREWTYSVRWGPVDPEWGFAEKSLGSKLCDLAQWAGGGFGAYRRSRTIAKLPVTAEWVREHYPQAGYPFDGSELDDDEEND